MNTESYLEESSLQESSLHEISQPSMASMLRGSIGLSIVALGVCGFLYSSAATGLGQLIFPEQANGSLIEQNGKIIASRLIAQPFTSAQYFHPRPSAANYDPMAMAGSNMALTNPELAKVIEQRTVAAMTNYQVSRSQIPSDLVTASGSGMDPDISTQSALIQVKSVAAARQISERHVLSLVQQHTKPATFGVMGKARVNVLELNLSLDALNK